VTDDKHRSVCNNARGNRRGFPSGRTGENLNNKAADRKFRGFFNANISWGGFQKVTNLLPGTRIRSFQQPFAIVAACGTALSVV
jgi:hypothetical protein